MAIFSCRTDRAARLFVPAGGGSAKQVMIIT